MGSFDRGGTVLQVFTLKYYPVSSVCLAYPCVPEQQVLRARSRTVRPKSKPAMAANIISTEKYMAPVAGMKAVNASDVVEDELVILRWKNKTR